MPPTSSHPSCQPQKGIHPLLRGIAIEGRAVTVRLLAYFSGLAMLAVIAADLVAGVVQDQPASAETANRALALDRSNLYKKSATYRNLRPPETRPAAPTRSAAAGIEPAGRIEAKFGSDWLGEAGPPRLRGRL